jgi:hypothetical protein
MHWSFPAIKRKEKGTVTVNTFAQDLIGNNQGSLFPNEDTVPPVLVFFIPSWSFA